MYLAGLTTHCPLIMKAHMNEKSKERASQKSSTYSIRATEEWKKEIENMQSLLVNDKEALEGFRFNSFVKEVIRAEVAYWQSSPYIALASEHMIYVDRKGKFFYRRQDRLRCNQDIEKMQVALSMKPPKLKATDASKHENAWELFWASVYREGNPPPSPRFDDCKNYTSGETTIKRAEIPVKIPANAEVIRENVVILDNYAQWQDNVPAYINLNAQEHPMRSLDSSYDWVDIVVDIPSRNILVSILVDGDIYEESFHKGLRSHGEPSIQMSLRSREHTEFKRDWQPIFDERKLDRAGYVGSHPWEEQKKDRAWRHAQEQVFSGFRDLETRLRSFQEPKPTIPRRPSSAMFYALNLPSWIRGGYFLVFKWHRPARMGSHRRELSFSQGKRNEQKPESSG